MKYAIILFTTLFYAQGFSQIKDVKVKTVSTTINTVIVYLDGAEVNREQQLTLSAGRTQVIFEGLSPNINSKSVQVTASGNVNILAVSDKINYLAPENENPRIKQLKDSVVLLNNKVVGLNDEKNAYTIEKEMLLKNQSIGGNQNGVPIAELKQAADFYRTRVKEINQKISSLNKKVTSQSLELQRVNQQLNELNAKENHSKGEVSVLLLAPSGGSTTISLKYIVAGAGWAPSYDLRAEDVGQPIELKYRAKVFNNTNIDWDNVKIKLSTADPTQSAAKPAMNVWNLDYQSSSGFYRQSYNWSNDQEKEGRVQSTDVGNYSSDRNTINRGDIVFEEIELPELSAEFEIETPYSIPSDAKPYIVDVTEYNLNATYSHYCIPKVDKDAFLLARITGWEDLNLVEGPANVYYAGTYIGQSYIYTRSVNDTLDLSLGRDKKVLVTRTKQKDFSSTKFIGSNKKETLAYEIIVKNNRKSPIQIEVIDQVPVSKNSDITVDVMDISNADRDLTTGELSWKFNIASGQSEQINLSFAMKYPKGRSINASKSKKRYRAKF